MGMKDLSECRILIVDDAKPNVDLLVGALKGEYKLSIALDGESALRNAAKNPPDLVLLDIMMPGIDGYEVCRRLREAEATRDVPVMFLSSLEDVQDKARGFEMGANDFLTKPFEILEVKARVRSLIKAKAYADAVREAMESELNVAREIQLGILPSDLSECTRNSGLDICAKIETAKQVGGDLYEVLRVGDDRIVVLIGDVSGKGIPASLFMAVTVTLARSMARQYENPAEILNRLNAELVVQNPYCMFVTMVCLVIDLRSGLVTGANAGHNQPVFVGADGLARFVFRTTGLVAGVMPDLGIRSESMPLSPGDTLILYTDGITEAFNPAGEMFGNERLLGCLDGETGRTAEETASMLMEQVNHFAAGAPQSDDIAIVVIRKQTE
jgi:sigma-B regulation protein RsbU (phosphoserine phosphatase)